MGIEQIERAAGRPVFMEVLGLLPPYSVEDVKKAYRERARRLHPDAGGDPEEFKALHAAYEQAVDFASFRQSRRHWLGDRVERYLEREQWLAAISEMGGCYELGRADSYIRDFGIDFAEMLRKLVAVHLCGPQIAQVDLSWIDAGSAVAGEIRLLTLARTSLSAEGLGQLSPLKGLRSLDLRATRVPKPDLSVLSSLPELEWIHLGGTGIGYWGRRQLRRAIPDLVIARKLAAATPAADSPGEDYARVLRRLTNL